EIRGEIVDVLRRERGCETGHDRIFARAGLVVAQRLGEIVAVLAGELRVVRDLAVAIHAVAGLARVVDDLLRRGEIRAAGVGGRDDREDGERAGRATDAARSL